MSLKKVVLLFTLFLHNNIYLRVSEETPQLQIGNFALPGSQRPGPLLGFGQNIVNKNDLLGLLSVDFLRGQHKSFTTVLPELLYGIRDNLSIVIEFPIAAQLKEGNFSSSGPSDLFIQLEYAFYIKEKETSTRDATIVAALYFPTGNYRKEPPTGSGSPSFFLGLTANRLATDWYTYISLGAFLTTHHGNHNKTGNNFFYQAGVGRNIAYKTHKWLLEGMIEFSGVYDQKSKSHGIVDAGSGSNTIFFGPSLWFSTQNLSLQTGVAPIIYQRNFGKQFKDRVFISLFIGWKFN